MTKEFLELLERIKNNDSTLHSLHVFDLNTTIGDEEAKALAAALEQNTVIRLLELYSADIGDEGAKALAAMLEKNITLRSLNVEDNKIGCEGAKAFAAALKKNTSLRSLAIGLHDIGDEGAKAFAAMLEENNTLIELSLFQSNIGDEGAKAFAAMLEKNTTLIELNLDSNSNIKVEGLMALAVALKTNSNLCSLVVCLGGMGVEIAQTFAAVHEKNTTLIDLWMLTSVEGIGGYAYPDICDAICRNYDLLDKKCNKILENEVLVEAELFIILSQLYFHGHQECVENHQQYIHDKAKLVYQKVQNNFEKILRGEVLADVELSAILLQLKYSHLLPDDIQDKAKLVYQKVIAKAILPALPGNFVIPLIDIIAGMVGTDVKIHVTQGAIEIKSEQMQVEDLGSFQEIFGTSDDTAVTVLKNLKPSEIERLLRTVSANQDTLLDWARTTGKKNFFAELAQISRAPLPIGAAAAPAAVAYAPNAMNVVTTPSRPGQIRSADVADDDIAPDAKKARTVSNSTAL